MSTNKDINEILHENERRIKVIPSEYSEKIHEIVSADKIKKELYSEIIFSKKYLKDALLDNVSSLKIGDNFFPDYYFIAFPTTKIDINYYYSQMGIYVPRFNFPEEIKRKLNSKRRDLLNLTEIQPNFFGEVAISPNSIKTYKSLYSEYELDFFIKVAFGKAVLLYRDISYNIYVIYKREDDRYSLINVTNQIRIYIKNK